MEVRPIRRISPDQLNGRDRVGNSPIIISKFDGSLHVTGTAQPIEYYIENFVRTGNPHGEDCSG